jgi:hypothetical protein
LLKFSTPRKLSCEFDCRSNKSILSFASLA